MLTHLITSIGPLLNQSLSAAVAIIAGSFFLYSFARDMRNRVARAFSALLFFVTVTYIGDLGVSYSNSLVASIPWLRFQWIGIAFAPAAYVHLSHAILTMTGLPSRGRRRWAVRLLYLLAAAFLALVTWTDLIVQDPVTEPAPHFQPGPVFSLFVIYFVGSVIFSLWFVIRARRRTLTQATHRRMTYLLLPYPAPALAVFPFLLISGQLLASPLVFYGLLTLVDGTLVVMLTFMSYAMAFIGALLPDRMIKAQMLQFFLRGPVVAIAVLAVVVWVPRASGVLGLPGNEVMPFLTVAVILFLQWAITLARPYLERWLIYIGDQTEFRRIQEVEARLLTGADFHQLLDTILTSICDYLRVKSAFVASAMNGSPRLEWAIGLRDDFHSELEEAGGLPTNTANGDLPALNDIIPSGDVLIWREFWLLPLHHQLSSEDKPRLVGLLGIVAPDVPEHGLEEEHWRVLMGLASRAAEVLEDRRLQSEVFAALEGILPEMSAIQHMREASRRGGFEALTIPQEDILSSPTFVQKVKDALAHYWGGPQLTDDSLMSLAVVRQALHEHEGNPQRAMRAVLQGAIEKLRPEGQRSMTTTEWILYNILEMRFIQGRKVRDVAMRLAMSESDLYRKQRVAIESVTATIAKMERAAATNNTASLSSQSALKHKQD